MRAIRFEQRFGFRIGKLTETLIQNAVNLHCFENLAGQRLFGELQLILKEEDPIGAIERMHGYDLLKFLSPELSLTQEVRTILKETKGILAWFGLLYLDITYEPWRVYFLGLISALTDDAFRKLIERLGLQEKEMVAMISARQEAGDVLDALYDLKDKKNYAVYRILSPLSPETLLYSMAKTRSEKVKRHISTFFTRLRGTEVFLKGRDLIALGYKPGPFFKEILEGLLEAKLEGDVSTKEDEIEFVKGRFARSNSLKKP